ncbi:MAG: hypothetical protein VB074_00480 [Proteiniphilum sp.]|uniref:hypothetical protein n=1 Tax=Proteiniphilum sp. TaxID=1926877 RepID=UPI002B207515|nr:hypothetical protein [Proteiniphilum sp.]MEA5126638.1 hypothetical protein [Proteiniphilum sp.]
MKTIKRIVISFILVLGLASNISLWSQDQSLSYQVILETKGEYNNLDRKSKINPDNWMNIGDFAALSQLYPILQFNSRSGDLATRLGVEANLRSYNFEKDSTRLLIQELYSQFTFKDKHYFVFGKKRLDWGSGMIWNPTNFFIQKDPLRTQNRLEGIFMLNYSYLFSESAISIYLFPDKKKENFKAAIKYDYSKDRIDAAVSFVEYGKYQQVGLDLSYGGNLFTFYGEGVLRNFSKSYKIDNNGILQIPDNRKKTFSSEFVVGGSVVFNMHLSFRGEYRFREDYLDKSQIRLFENQLPDNLMIWDAISVSKHTLFASFDYRDTYSRWSANLRTFYDPLSNQLIVSPLGVLTMNNFQIEASTIFYNNKLSIHNFQSTILLSCFF